MEYELEPIRFYPTTCCSMLIASMKNYHSYEEISYSLNRIHKRSDSHSWKPEDRSGGERNVLCMISPGEDMLEANLIKLGFKNVADDVPRRIGYPEGTLKMYLLSWPRL